MNQSITLQDTLSDRIQLPGKKIKRKEKGGESKRREENLSFLLAIKFFQPIGGLEKECFVEVGALEIQD